MFITGMEPITGVEPAVNVVRYGYKVLIYDYIDNFKFLKISKNAQYLQVSISGGRDRY